MGYTVLARKYRSQGFDDVIGQSAIAQTLENSIAKGRVAHAYLFTGTRGVGKTTMARILAKALNCLKSDEPTTKPCCECESCLAVNAGNDIDVIEIDGASNNGVEQVRELRENAIYRPNRSRYKIYIIDEVHMLSVSAFNALLKTLEEPPEHVKFIFATTEPNKVIDTIQSRCQRFDFRNIGTSDIGGHLKDVLKREKVNYEDDLIPPLAKMANGSMRDALSLLDRLISTGEDTLTADTLEKFLGCPDRDKVFALAQAMANSDTAQALKGLDDLLNGGLSGVQIIDAVIDCMRDLMISKADGSESELLILTGKQKEQVKELSECFDLPALVYNITALEKMRWAVKNSEMNRALLESVILRLTLSEQFIGVDNLVSKIQSGAGIKKKSKITKSENPAQNKKPEPKPEPSEKPDVQINTDFKTTDDVKNNWQRIMNIVSEQAGNGTSGLLNNGQPLEYRDGVLEIGFDQKGRFYKTMCEKTEKKNQIENVFSQIFARKVRVDFELIQNETSAGQPKEKSESEKKQEVLKDPSVKQVISGFKAKITKVDCK